jgi:uncharacterized protein (UPF0335 family)
MATEKGDNSGDATFRAVKSELTAFIERIEILEADKKEIADQVKDVKLEAKSKGYDTKALTAVLRRRKQDRDAVSEHDAIVALYESTIDIFD